MAFINITGGGIRSDIGGEGHWYASRGSKKHHEGIDLLLPYGPGQRCVAPHGGFIWRISYPYSDDYTFRGLVLRGEQCFSKIFYVDTPTDWVGRKVRAGQYIGVAQDISKRYKDVEPHVHWEIMAIDPSLLL